MVEGVKSNAPLPAATGNAPAASLQPAGPDVPAPPAGDTATPAATFTPSGAGARSKLALEQAPPCDTDPRQAAMDRLEEMSSHQHDGYKVFSQVPPGQEPPELYRGSLPSLQQMQDLKAIGVKTIVSFLDPTKSPAEARKFQEEQANAQQAGLTLISVPWAENDLPGVIATQIQKFEAIANNPENQPVYVHCAHGEDRTGAAVAKYSQDKGISSWKADLMSHGYHQGKYHNLDQYLGLPPAPGSAS